MNFKTGDVVTVTGDIVSNMSVMGFLEFPTENLADISQDPLNREWVVCQYRLENWKFEIGVFHKNQLKLDDNMIDGGTPIV